MHVLCSNLNNPSIHKTYIPYCDELERFHARHVFIQFFLLYCPLSYHNNMALPCFIYTGISTSYDHSVLFAVIGCLAGVMVTSWLVGSLIIATLSWKLFKAIQSMEFDMQ